MKQLEQKNHYVLKIIHDLKVPTLAQIGALESFIKTSCNKLSEEENNLILLTLNSCAHMENLIEIYSTLEQLNQNSAQLTYEKFNISKIIEKLLLKENILINYKKIKIKTNFENNILLNADKNLISKALINIMSTCLNNTFRENELCITINKNRDYLYFEITYQGNPLDFETIVKARKYNINKRFEQPNYNIGLHLANKIILSHFGTMSVQNTINNKSLIGFKIPI